MTHTFTSDLSGLMILTDRQALFDEYFIDGHPHALIPGYLGEYNHFEHNLPNGLTGTIDDIDQLMSSWPAATYGWTDYESYDGSEYDPEYALAEDGLITIGYTLYQVSHSGQEFEKIRFMLTGYVITHPVDEYQIFVVTSITHVE